jgi:hypothetical protein
MTLPSEYLILRQPGRVAEVVFVQHGAEHVMFSGKRWDARRSLLRIRQSIGFEHLPVYVRKETGAIELSERVTL